MTNQRLPIILIRGFGFFSVEDEKRLPYQGFNEGTVYHQRVGENYIYEGMILRFLKDLRYTDATNVVGYYADKRDLTRGGRRIPASVAGLTDFMKGDRVVLDPEMAAQFASQPDKAKKSSLWVFRYYDLDDRKFETYGRALQRLIDIVLNLTKAEKVNIIAHSMGGLIARYAVQMVLKQKAEKVINKIVTLGTPHRGIDFQVIEKWIVSEAREELNAFNPKLQGEAKTPKSYKNFSKCFPLERLLCIVGTNYRTYSVGPSVAANRLFSVAREGSWAYNRSDGLVSHQSAYIDGAHRSFVHKCHGGYDSLVTARESYEIATRFFFGTHRARLVLVSAKVNKGKDWFGNSEFYIGVSVKPRNLDFELWHQSKEAENCFGPFSEADLGKIKGKELAEIFLDRGRSLGRTDIVFRLELYVGERDTYGVGFSDQEITKQQFFLQAKLNAAGPALILHPTPVFGKGEKTLQPGPGGDWEFDIEGSGKSFEGRFRVILAPA